MRRDCDSGGAKSSNEAKRSSKLLKLVFIVIDKVSRDTLPPHLGRNTVEVCLHYLLESSPDSNRAAQALPT